MGTPEKFNHPAQKRKPHTLTQDTVCQKTQAVETGLDLLK